MMRLLQDTGATRATRTWRPSSQERRARELGEEIADAVGEVHARGCVVKDLGPRA